MEFFLQNLINALSLGSLFALLALGISLIFGIMRLINFAHGELIMAGGYVLYLLTYKLSDVPLPVYFVVAVAFVALLAVLMERAGFRPLRGAEASTLLVGSFAISIGLQHASLALFGGDPVPIVYPAFAIENFAVGDFLIPKVDVITIVVTIVLLIGLAGFLKKSDTGIRMRAAAEDFSMARLLGVRANSVVAAAFLISGGLAGIVSFFYLAKIGTVVPRIGLDPVLVGIVATVIGGLGKLVGAVLGGFVLGLVTIMAQAYLPVSVSPFRDSFVFGAVIIILLLRPAGLLSGGSAARRV